MRKLILILFLLPTVLFGQIGASYIRTPDSSLAITNNDYPDDTLFKFTKSGHLIKYEANVSVDTFALKSESGGGVSDTANFAYKSDSSLYSDTSGYALNATKDSVFISVTANTLLLPNTDELDTAEIYLDDSDLIIQVPSTKGVILNTDEEITVNADILDINLTNDYQLSSPNISAFSAGDATIFGNDSATLYAENEGVAVKSNLGNVGITTKTSFYNFDGNTLDAELNTGIFKNVIARLGSFIGNLVADKIEVDTAVVGEDTLTGGLEFSLAVEASSFDKLRYDTTITNNDTITGIELLKAVRKILYPNNYSSYLPNDSTYTTPSIVSGVLTKILIPTALKHSRNWEFFDKGGSDFALRYEYADSSRFNVNLTTSMRTSASNVVFEMFMFKNGVIEEGVASERKIGTGADVGAIGITGSFDASTNDYIEIYVLVDVTTTITFSKTSIIITEDGEIL